MVEARSNLSQRDLHIQNILAFQKRKTSSTSHSQEKILLICACKSIAQDFYDFETYRGWEAKRDRIARRLLRGEDPSIQTISKHLRHYLTSQSATQAYRVKLDAALRLGIKLEVVDFIGQAAGFGGCLSLLFGFQCAKFTRLSYAAFGLLRNTLESDSTLYTAITRFGETVGNRWFQCQQFYYQRFRKITNALETPSTCLTDLADQQNNPLALSLLPDGEWQGDGNFDQALCAAPLADDFTSTEFTSSAAEGLHFPLTGSMTLAEHGGHDSYGAYLLGVMDTTEGRSVETRTDIVPSHC